MTGDGKSLCEGEYKADGGVSYEYISDRRKREREGWKVGVIGERGKRQWIRGGGRGVG